MMITFMIRDDPHRYNNRRLLVQIVLVTLLIADYGERGGAILQSEAHRKNPTRALCYGVKSVQLVEKWISNRRTGGYSVPPTRR